MRRRWSPPASTCSCAATSSLRSCATSGATLFGLISTPDLVAWTGALTALFAGLIAFSQNDIKKVLAYSTVSQLGFMVAAVGMGAYVAAMFHLITHAFFKALLFLGSGSVIHGMEHGPSLAHAGHSGERGRRGAHTIRPRRPHGNATSDEIADGFDPQDMRYMGGLRRRMRTTYIVYMIGSLALAGILPLAGFWSKDEILLHARPTPCPSSSSWLWPRWVRPSTSPGSSSWSSSASRATPRPNTPPKAHRLMTTPLIVLAVLTVFGGLLNLPYLSRAMAEANHDAHGGRLPGWSSGWSTLSPRSN
jgi:NADH-quinone oxidoreductase subunit L